MRYRPMSFRASCRIPSLLFLCLAALALGGCALGKTYSEINPEGALEDMRRANGYYALQSVRPDTAKLVFRSSGQGHAVTFSASESPIGCEGLKKEGVVRHRGSGIVYPWVAKMNGGMSNSKPFIEKELSRPATLQVQAYEGVWDSTPFSRTVAGCGPVTARFSPRPDRAYVIEFVLSNATCRLEVKDATQPEAPLPVALTPIPDCPRI